MNNRIAGGPHDPFSYRLSGKSYDAVASAVTDSALTLRCSVHCSMTPNGSARLWSLRCVGDWLRGGTTVPNREGGIADHLAHLRAISVRLGTCQTEINSDKVCQLNRMSKDTKAGGDVTLRMSLISYSSTIAAPAPAFIARGYS
jgi:hypothetical protein